MVAATLTAHFARPHRTLRRTLAEVLQAALGAVDLIELRRVNLAIRASVAEEVLPRIGQDTLAWRIFCNALGAIRKIFIGANAMRLALYQAETARIAAVQRALLTEAKAIPSEGRALTPLEQSGIMRALQTLIENAIIKATQWLKASEQLVPISGNDSFSALANSARRPEHVECQHWPA